MSFYYDFYFIVHFSSFADFFKILPIMDEKTIVYVQTKINKNFIKCKKISKFAADCVPWGEDPFLRHAFGILRY